MKTNYQDPQTSEIHSTQIAGIQESLGKLEDSVGMETVAGTGIALAEVYISATDRYRIYQAPAGKRNWVASPAPVVKKNGVTVTEGFTIDYAGGAIIVSPSAISTDVFTADVTYMAAMATSFKTHLAENAQSFINTNAAISTMGIAKTKEVNTASIYARAIEEMKTICLDGLKQSKKSINETATHKTAVIGTSISDTSDLNNSNDGYFAKVCKSISDQLTPMGVTVTSQNFALGGRTMGAAASSTYVAVNPEPTDISLGFWRWWSTAGKSWRDHIKDYAPDLLIIEFGMNDGAGYEADYNYYTYLNSFVTYAKTWAKVPDIVIIPTILPTTNASYSAQRQDVTNAVARAAREYAKLSGCIVADVNRLWQILRDGKDETTRVSTVESNFYGFPAEWSGSTSDFTLAANELTPSAGLAGRFVARNRNYLDGIIDVDVKPASGAAYISYRKGDLGKLSVLVIPGSAGAGSIYLYGVTSASATIKAKTGLTILSGTYYNIRIESKGINHKVYLNGVLQVEADTYKVLHEGTVELGSSTEVPTFKNLKVKFSDPITFNPIYTEIQLLGPYNDTTQDGNGINHPTPAGNALAFVPAFGFISELSNKKESGLLVPTRVGSASWIAASTPFPTTTSAGEKIYYYALLNSNYRKDRGIVIQRQDTFTYYTLSDVAISQVTLASLEPGKFCYYSEGANDLIFISVPAAGAVAWDIDCFRYK